MHSYSRLDTVGSDRVEIDRSSKVLAPHLYRYAFFIAGIISVFVAGFVSGRSASDHRKVVVTASPVQLPEYSYVFQQNRTFGEAPSLSSDHAWESLFPKRGGFFTHLDIAPQRSAFAVFHQLHCLDAIRQAYWTVFAAATDDQPLLVEDLPFMISPPHVRHCIDLIRQTLMCQPDLTIEVKNETLGGVTGFGTLHQCKNWDALLGWVGKWEDNGAPVHPPEGHSHHEHGHGD